MEFYVRRGIRTEVFATDSMKILFAEKLFSIKLYKRQRNMQNIQLFMPVIQFLEQ